VSGDFKRQGLLEQTKDTGVDVYTHSEMLPAHYYPAFKKYHNFADNYGYLIGLQISISFMGVLQVHVYAF
jgi:hydroxylamine reductase